MKLDNSVISKVDTESGSLRRNLRDNKDLGCNLKDITDYSISNRNLNLNLNLSVTSPMELSSDGEENPITIMEGKKRQRMIGENSTEVLKNDMQEQNEKSTNSARQGNQTQ